MQPFKASKTQMVIRVGYQPNGSTENKFIYYIKDKNIKRVIQRGFYREQVLANKHRFIFQPRTFCNKDNHKGVGHVHGTHKTF